MREFGESPPRFEKFPVQSSEQPAFHFRRISQLVAFSRPNIKCLLCQITRIRLRLSQTDGKLIKRAIVARNQGLKIQTHSLIGTIINRTHQCQKCSQIFVKRALAFMQRWSETGVFNWPPRGLPASKGVYAIETGWD